MAFENVKTSPYSFEGSCFENRSEIPKKFFELHYRHLVALNNPIMYLHF